jgi:hypothetical protein
MFKLAKVSLLGIVGANNGDVILAEACFQQVMNR